MAFGDPSPRSGRRASPTGMAPVVEGSIQQVQRVLADLAASGNPVTASLRFSVDRQASSDPVLLQAEGSTSHPTQLEAARRQRDTSTEQAA